MLALDHADPLQQPDRRDIGRRGGGADLVELQRLEVIAQQPVDRFGGIAAALVGLADPVADLTDRVRVGEAQADRADEDRVVGALDRVGQALAAGARLLDLAEPIRDAFVVVRRPRSRRRSGGAASAAPRTGP